MRRTPIAPGRTRYRVSRPSTPLDCCWALVQAVGGAGAITAALSWTGLI